MKLFGTDGVRGTPNRFPLDLETVVLLGRAIGRTFRTSGKTRFCLARDTRQSGTFLAAAVTSGLTSEGVDVLDLGIQPTPACAALLRFYGAQGGVVVSASHNPAEDNGIKVFTGEGYKLTPDEEGAMEAFVAAERGGGPGSEGPAECLTVGEVLPAPRGLQDYLRFLAETVPGLSLSGMKLVADCANGAMVAAGPAALRQLGADVTVIHDTPDGTNINEQCGSEHPEGAALAVREHGAAAGLVFDGDGDRVILIDENGATVDGDHILACLAIDRAARNELPGSAIACTDYSNKGLDIALASAGIRAVRRGVGDRDVLATMREFGYVLGGEQSGHVIFSRLATTGDGLLTALQVLELLKRTGTPLSELTAVMTALPQILLNVEVAEKAPLAKLSRTAETIRDVERRLADRGRVYVRYSGTQNVLRVMVEGEDKEGIRNLAQEIAEAAQNEISANIPA